MKKEDEWHQFLSSAIEQSSEGIAIADLDGKLMYVNPAWARMHGYDSGTELIGRTLEIFHNQEQIDLEVVPFNQIVLEKGENRGEVGHIRKDGTPFPTTMTTTLLKNAKGKPVALLGIAKDITEQQRLTEALRASEERFQLAMRGANDGLWDWNLMTDEVYFSPRWKSMLGYAADEIEPHIETWKRLMVPEDLKRTMAFVRDFLDGRHQKYEVELPLRHKDGSYRHVLSRGFLVNDEKGRPVRMVGTHVDITERKLAEEKLRRSEKRFSDIINKMTDAIFISDLNGSLIDANRKACDSLAYSKEELLRLSVADVDPQFSADDHPENVWSQLPPDGTITIESKHKRRDGSLLPVEISIGKIELNGEPAVLGVARDITERKQAEDQIHILDGLIDIAPASILIHDFEGNILYANQTSFDMHGYSREEFLSLTLRDLDVPESAALIEARMRQISETGTATFEVVHRRKDGSTFPMQVFVKMAKWGEKAVLFSIGSDISERHLLEAEQLRSQKLEAIGTLAGGIAHDFNNLLQGVFGHVSLAKLAVNQPEEVTELLDQAEKAISLSVNLTNQLLTYAKGGRPVKKKASITPLIENATKFALSGSRCDYQMHLDPDLWPMEVDEGQMAQVIQNIVLNASEAMPEGGIIDLSAENISLPHGGRQIRIAIKDTGIGIAQSYSEKIFDPYFTTKQKGSGLGLATSYSIVNNHGGSISVETEQNQGTTFFITLPASDPEIPETMKPQTPLAGQWQKRRILLMDDEAMVRKVARKMVEAMGHDIDLACHGEEAIEKYQSALMSADPFELVILDLTIKGGMGGKETIKKLREIDPLVKAVVSSGYSDSPVVSEYEDFGFQGLLNKPYTIKALGECLNGLF